MGSGPAPSRPPPPPPPTNAIPEASRAGNIIFFARYSNPPDSWLGHIWISIESVGTYGFYPGGIRDDGATPSDLKYLRFREKAQLNRAVDVLRAYNSRSYNLITQNCIKLCEEAARATGLNATSGLGKNPAQWIADLAIANL